MFSVYSKKYPFHIILLSRKKYFFDMMSVSSPNGDHESKIHDIMLKKQYEEVKRCRSQYVMMKGKPEICSRKR